MVLAAGSLLAADSNPKDDVKAAAAALGASANYSWHQTVEVPADSRFKPGPTDGKTEKGGYTSLSMSFGDNTSEVMHQGHELRDQVAGRRLAVCRRGIGG